MRSDTHPEVSSLHSSTAALASCLVKMNSALEGNAWPNPAFMRSVRGTSWSTLRRATTTSLRRGSKLRIHEPNCASDP
jgi:hypothetical protein